MAGDMLTFQVTGLRNGVAGSWKVKAANVVEARRRAEGSGVQNPEVTFVPALLGPAPAPVVRTPPPVEESHEFDSAADEPGLADAAAAAHLNYATPAARAKRVPDYKEISQGALVLRIASSILIMLGIVLAGLTALAVIRSADRLGTEATTIILVSGIVPAIGLIASGLLLQMLGAVAMAVRDIARNSFH